MSKRKTPDKGSLNGPRAKRQKLSHSKSRNHNSNNHNMNGKQTIGRSRICNYDNDDHSDNNKKSKILSSHCYDIDNNDGDNNDNDNDNYNLSLIEIKKHNISTPPNFEMISNENNNNNNKRTKAQNGYNLRNENCDKLCSKLGQRVKIYWKEDKQWYYGTIKDYKSSTKQSLIVYDDDENEWLNLTKSGNETVEFLYDPIHEKQGNKNKDSMNSNNSNSSSSNKNMVKIGNRISSGKVLQTFNHGCIANINLRLDNRTNTNFTAIAFDNKYIQYLMDNQLIPINPFQSDHDDQNDNHNNNNTSTDIFRLLHLCQFDKSVTNDNNNNNNNNLNGTNSNKNGHRNHRRPNRKSLRNRNRNTRSTSNNNNNNDIVNNNEDITSWTAIGCTSENDPISKTDTESHINLIHSSNNYRNSKHKSNNGYYGNSSHRMNKKSRNSSSSNSPNSHVGKNNNNITKKCNTKSIVDLKAIYPLEKIRQQNHAKKRTIIVIGAGISGLSCARECMNYGYNVIVLEVELIKKK